MLTNLLLGLSLVRSKGLNVVLYIELELLDVK